MSKQTRQKPLQRRLLWGFLLSVLVAVVVTAVMAPRWRLATVGEPPPVLGQVPSFELVNHDGRSVTERDLLGAPWIGDFIFSRCALSCPRMTSRMIQLGRLLPKGAAVARVSISVDPDYDTPQVLRQYADSWGVKDPIWYFLTGERVAIHTMIREGFRLAVDASPARAEANPLEPIVHSTRFVLVDGENAIRGYYDVGRGEELSRLVHDLRALLKGE